MINSSFWFNSQQAMPKLLLALSIWIATPTAGFAQNWVDRSPASTVHDLALDPSNKSHWIAQTSEHPLEFQETLNGGNSWQVIPLPADAVAPAAATFGPAGNLYLTIGRNAAPVSGESYLFVRDTTGWSALAPPTTASIKHWASHFVIGEADPDLMAFIMVEWGNLAYGLNTQLYLSEDAGLTWAPPTPWLGEPSSLEILETGAGPRIIRSDAFHPSTGIEVYYFISDDWSAPGTSLNQSDPELMASLGTSRQDPLDMLFSTYGPQEFAWLQLPMQRSTDGGLTWSDEGAPGHYSNLMRGKVDGDLAVRHAGYSTQEGVHVSRDNGLTWNAISNPPGVSHQRFEILLGADDSKLFAFGSFGLFETEMILEIGTSECSSELNGSGLRAQISAHGSTSIATNDLILWVHDVTPGQFGLLVTSQLPGFVPNPGASFGNLCLSGAIGRFHTQILHSGPFGEYHLGIDLQALPTPNQPVAAQAGETWRFQAWYRDRVSGQQGSNFSDAVAVVFRP